VKKTIVVSGASSSIGTYLLPMLSAQGYNVFAISRSRHKNKALLQWVRKDISTPIDHLPKADICIHLAPLPLAANMMDALLVSGIKRFIAFGSTSIFTKIHATSQKDREFVQIQQDMEQWLKDTCEQHDIVWTLFRPTMIYGADKDKNITFIRSMIEKFGVFPIAGKSQGLRQPVHAEDLATACVAVLENNKTANNAYNLSGGEALTYREMVERIFSSLHKNPRVVRLNPFIYKCAIIMIRKILSRYAFVQTSMVDRMSMDMVFDHADASKDFAYDPRSFQP